MLNKLFMFFFIYLSIIYQPVFADVLSQDITNALPKDLNHPYLYFTLEEKPALLERIANDPECSDISKRLLAEANRLIYTPVEREAPPVSRKRNVHYSNEREQYQRNNRHAAYQLAFAYQITGEEKYAQKAFEFADVVCDLDSWVLRYHQFPIIYTRVWPWNVPDDQATFGCDLWAADTAKDLAAVYDWIYPALTEHQRDRIRGALLEKAILTVRGNYEYHWWSTSYRCNWCGVCNSGLGITALSLLTEDPQLVDVVAESYNRITRMLDEIGVDGGWQEGCGYWYYGVSSSIRFADTLKRITNGEYNIFTHPRLAENTVNCPLFNLIPPDRTVNFEDSGFRRIGATFFYNKLASETGSREAAWYRDNIFGEGTDIFDIIWPRSSIVPGLPKQYSHHFRSIDWVVMRSDFTNPDHVVVACKAGYHDDPHHGHLDCGHFMVFWHGQGYVSEMERATYDERYFEEKRWEFPQASSLGHNVLFINGELQIPAKLKDKSWKENIGGKILEFRTTETRDYTLMDPSGAYPGKELKGWRRHIILEKPFITIVVDEIKSSINAEIEARFHSEVTQRVRGRYLLLDGEKGDMALIPVTDNSFTLRTGKHAVLPYITGARFTWYPYCGIVMKARKRNSVIATIILPVDSEYDAEAVVRSVKRDVDSSGNLVLSFSKNGKTYSYTFIKGKDGLVLE